MVTSFLHLVLDVGNTRTKLGLYGPRGALRWTVMANGDGERLEQWLGPQRPWCIALGSVAAQDAGLLAKLRAIAPVHAITGTAPSPLASLYQSPVTLGVDRLANAVAAALLFPGRHVLAIDAGTCITYDLVSADMVYQGGIIAPGLRMRARAMHHYSARLPLVDPAADTPLLGSDTRSSLGAGVHHGMVAEVSGIVDTLRHQWPGLAVVLTGGDAPRFAFALKSGIFAHPLLTLDGLHALLLHKLALDPAVGSDAPRPGDGAGPAG